MAYQGSNKYLCSHYQVIKLGFAPQTPRPRTLTVTYMYLSSPLMCWTTPFLKKTLYVLVRTHTNTYVLVWVLSQVRDHLMAHRASLWPFPHGGRTPNKAGMCEGQLHAKPITRLGNGPLKMQEQSRIISWLDL